jgi:hypothetical protein
MGSGRGLLILLALTAAALTQLGFLLVDVAVLPFLVTLLAAHLDRESGALARLLVTAASRLLPRDKRQDELEEWLDHVESAGEHGVLPLTRALSIAAIAAPALALGLRVGRPRRRRSFSRETR